MLVLFCAPDSLFYKPTQYRIMLTGGEDHINEHLTSVGGVTLKHVLLAGTLRALSAWKRFHQRHDLPSLLL